jgi:hypothetical protein
MDNLSSLVNIDDSNGNKEARFSNSPFKRSRWRLLGFVFWFSFNGLL